MTLKNTKGFTLVELVLAMALFITILIATTTAFIGINRTYSKGVIRKQLSEAVQRTVEDITKTIRESRELTPQTADDLFSKYALCNDASCYVWKKKDGSDNKRLVRTTGNDPVDVNNAYELVDDRYTIDFINIEKLETDLYRISGVMRTADDKDAFEFEGGYPNYISLQDPSKIRCKGTTEANSVRGCNLEKFEFVVNTKAGSE